MKITNIIAISLLSVVSSFGFEPKVGLEYSTAPGGKIAASKQFLNSGVVITVTPILVPATPSPNWGTAVDSALSDLLSGNLTNTVATSPGQYALCNYRIHWENLVYSTSSHMWDGVLNPASPFDKEYGHVVWWIIDATSGSGSDDLSLDMVTVSAVSSDGGILNGSTGFGGVGYTTRAIAIKSDGTIINSGSTSQKGKRVIVFYQSKLFNGGGTDEGLLSVKNWVTGKADYKLTVTGSVNGDPNSASSASVSTVSVPVSPSLNLANGVLSIPNAENGRTYRIYSRPRLDIGNWTFSGLITGNSTLPVSYDNASMFFKAMAQ